MLFHSFISQTERREFGGSDFIEIQYCKLNRCATIEKIVSIDTVKNWKDESLYICGDNWDIFYTAYGEIIIDGTYANLESGPLDWCGINYFSPEQTASIRKLIKEEKPSEYQTLLSWLEAGEQYNGFYVLGL